MSLSAAQARVLLSRSTARSWRLPGLTDLPQQPAPVAAEHRSQDSELQQLAERGLVVLLNGGTRAQLTGAGRWCSEEGDDAGS